MEGLSPPPPPLPHWPGYKASISQCRGGLSTSQQTIIYTDKEPLGTETVFVGGRANIAKLYLLDTDVCGRMIFFILDTGICVSNTPKLGCLSNHKYIHVHIQHEGEARGLFVLVVTHELCLGCINWFVVYKALIDRPDTQHGNNASVTCWQHFDLHHR